MPIIGFCGKCEKFFHDAYDYLKHMQNKHDNFAPKFSLFSKGIKDEKGVESFSFFYIFLLKIFFKFLRN